MLSAGTVLVAVALDASLGEPAPRWHPVVWAGEYLARAGRAVPPGPPVRAVALGGVAWSLGALVSVAAGAGVARVARHLSPPLGAAVGGTALWPLLSARLLLREVAGVEEAVSTDPEGGRRALARIVSRDTAALSPDQVRAAAIESLAENLSDALVAPLFWFVVGGLPGAALHRWANTADAMWGYRTARWEHAGKVAARADDLLNLAPARLTAVLLAGPRPAVLRRVRGEARRTSSPNAGWPMGTVALRLGLRLAKEDAYVLNPAGSAPQPDDVAAALSVAGRAAVAAALLAVVAAATADHPHRPRGAA